jgi:nucleoid DNA-binding protein
MEEKVVLKKHIAKAIASEIGMTKKASLLCVDVFLDTITRALERGVPVKLSKFGKLDVRIYSGESNRNPKTGELMNDPPYYRPFFKWSPFIKRRIKAAVK